MGVSGDEPTLAARAERCILSFQTCIQAQGEGSSSYGESLYDQLARFNVFAGNIGVFASIRASLDYRLKDSPDVSGMVAAILDLLSNNLSRRRLSF